MALNVISNFGANVALRNLASSDLAATRSVAKLSAGTRVLAARDAAAALAIGSGLRAEVASLKQATVNAGQAASMLQIAEGAMSTVTDILIRMKSLSVQSASGQLSNIERATLNAEFVALRAEIDRIADDTEFNGSTLVKGTVTSTTGTADQVAGQTIGTAEGVTSVTFDDNVDAVFELTFANAGDGLTLTNLVTNTSETIGLGAATITATQTVRFETTGATVVLNSTFNKGADIATTIGTNTFTLATGAGAITDASIAVTDSFGVISTINTGNISLDATTAAASVLTLTAATGGKFVSAAEDLTVIGTHTVTLNQGAGANPPSISISISFVVTTAFTDDGTPDTIALNSLNNIVNSFQLQTGTSNFTFKLGTSTAAQDDVTLTIDSVTTTALGINASTIDTAANANTAVTALDTAIDTINTARANVGRGQSRRGPEQARIREF